MNKLLKPEEIVNKTFSTQKKGYNPGEVDAFLDRINESYEMIIRRLAKAKHEMIEQTDKINVLENDVQRGNIDISKKLNKEETYLHTLDDNMAKRMSTIEEKIELVLEKVSNN